MLSPAQSQLKAMRKVQALLSERSRWTKGEYARCAKGKLVSPTSRYAVCWCLAGALYKAIPDRETRRSCRGLLEQVIAQRYDIHSVLVFNDYSFTRFASIKRAIKDAVRILEKRAAA